mgnify:CR=1 FL=1
MTLGIGFKNITKAIRHPKETIKALKKQVGDKINASRKIIKKNGGVMKTLWKGIKGPMGMVGKVMKGAMAGMLYFMLFLLGAFLIFSVIREILGKAEVMETIMGVLSGVFEGVMTVVSGIFDIFGAFFGEGTFGERLAMLIGGFGKIFGGLGKILWSVLKGVVMFAWDIVLAYVTFVFDFWVGLIKGIFRGVNKLFGGALDFIGSIFAGIRDFIMDNIWGPIDTYIIGPITDFFTMIGDFIDEALDWLGGGAVGDAAGDAWDSVTGFFGMHTGGIAQGGMTMVGERGPELMNIPKGTSVHSNDTTKNMMGKHTTNNISVNVNGRLGASDTELRDIAKKIGKMVSTEINRTTSSSTNVRF